MADRERYHDKMQEQLDEWGVDLEKLRVKARTVGKEAQADINNRIETLEHKLDDGRVRLKHLAESTGDAWDSVKDGVEAALASLKAGFYEAAEKYKKH